MFRLLFSLFLTSLLYLSPSQSACAAPLRTAKPKGIVVPFKQPKDRSTFFLDKFVIAKRATNREFTVTYQSVGDPIFFESLTGGVITSLQDDGLGTVTITFRSNSSNGANPTYIRLFTEARANVAVNETGILAAMHGSWASSKLADMNSRLVFTDEPVGSSVGNSYLANLRYGGNSKKNLRDNPRIFLSGTLLQFLNGIAQPADQLQVRQLSGGSYQPVSTFSAVAGNSGGVLLTIPVVFANTKTKRLVQLGISGVQGLVM